MTSRTALWLALLFATVSGYSTSAQQQPGRVAVDHCGATVTDDPYDEDGYEFWCGVHVHDLASGYSWEAGSGDRPALSPDGTRLAFFAFEDSPSEPSKLMIVNLRDGSRTTLLQSGSDPSWSVDGRIAFVSGRSGTPELYVINANGSGLTQVTRGGVSGSPSWSPDGRIAFVCKTDLERTDICSIYPEGTQFARLTNLGNVRAAVLSPDGTRIAFVRSSSPAPLGILNADGTITDLNWYGIYDPSWSPDGRRIAFSGEPSGGGCEPDAPYSCGYSHTYSIDVNGTDVAPLTWGGNPSWGLSPSDGLPPTAFFTVECTVLACAFDAAWSRDDGAIASYQWTFGDGSVATGVTPAHTYAAAGGYEVELTVVDNAGVRASTTRVVNVTDHVNSPPDASFAVACLGLACTFDASGSSDSDDGIASYRWTFGDGGGEWTSGRLTWHTYVPGTYVVTLTVMDRSGASDSSNLEIRVTNAPPTAGFVHQCDAFAFCTLQPTGSSDPDGSIVSYIWDLGDGQAAAGGSVTHTYAAAGIYVVALTVTDNHGATSTQSAAITVQRAVFHVGDLDGAATQVDKKMWKASVNVVVHDADHQAVNAGVVGVWSTGVSGPCYFDSNGVCTVAAMLPTSAPRVTFTVQGVWVSAGTPPYDAVRNHDVDGGTNGTSITISRR